MFQNVNADRTGLSRIDWGAVAEHYPTVGRYEVRPEKIVHRDEVMLALVHDDVAPTVDVPLEDVCKNLLDKNGAGAEVRKMAKVYITLRNKNARLPGFGKWVSSMFKNNPAYVTIMAKAGQHERGKAAGGIVISCNPVDILRGGIGRHFQTCLWPDVREGGWGGAYADVLPAVLEECAGVAVAFIEDGEAYRARCWVHHIRVNGKDAVQINSPYGNGITEAKLAALIASKGYDVYNQGYGGDTKYEFVNNFKRRIHWDAIETRAGGNLIAAAKPIIKKKAA